MDTQDVAYSNYGETTDGQTVELPSQTMSAPQQTLGDWLQITNEIYSRSSPRDAFEYFITDVEARNPCIIHIEMSCYGVNARYTCYFCRFSAENTKNVRGYSDIERQELTNDSPMTIELRNAILASASRRRVF